MLGPRELAAALGFDPAAHLTQPERQRVAEVPFGPDLLRRSAQEGRLLVLRLARDPEGQPLTIASLATRLAAASAHRLEKPIPEAWFASEPFAARETCSLGWALVDARPLPETGNLTYSEQSAVLEERARRFALRLRRRSAVEIVHDTLLFATAHGERLLQTEWDWSSSTASDGGRVAAGEFAEGGLKLVAYSKGVRFLTLGICANVDGGPPA